MRKLFALALFLGLALAEIGAPIRTFFDHLQKPGVAGKPLKLEKGYVQVETLDGLLYKVRYVGPKDAVDEAARVLAATVGDDGIQGPFKSWYQGNRALIEQQKRPVRVGLGPAYVLTIQVKDDLRFEVGPVEVPESAFGKPRHVLGKKGPLVREYSDFYCPYCQRLALTVLPEIKKLANQGLLRFEYRHFPLIEIHADAFQAAEASECAAEQDKFWPYHDRLFAELQKGKGVNYVALAKELGLKVEKFRACLEGEKYRDVVKAMRAEAEALGLNGTPTVFVGPFKLPNPFDVDAYARYARMAKALGQKGR